MRPFDRIPVRLQRFIGVWAVVSGEWGFSVDGSSRYRPDPQRRLPDDSDRCALLLGALLNLDIASADVVAGFTSQTGAQPPIPRTENVLPLHGMLLRRERGVPNCGGVAFVSAPEVTC